jgi:methylmalonyl-CoA mutase N-terminal domain/subunit
MQGADGGILTVDPSVEAEQREALERWRAGRDQAAVDAALAELARVAPNGVTSARLVLRGAVALTRPHCPVHMLVEAYVIGRRKPGRASAGQGC